jgi:hypothetical protein
LVESIFITFDDERTTLLGTLMDEIVNGVKKAELRARSAGIRVNPCISARWLPRVADYQGSVYMKFRALVIFFP